MTAIKIAFANQKGGVGKSTICTQTAFFLAGKMGKKVLVIDADAQGNSTSTLLQRAEPTGTFSHQLLDPDLESVEIMRTPHENIDLIGSPRNSDEGYDAEALDLELVTLPAERIAQFEDQYDYILIDCPPCLGRKLLSALVMTQFVVCPVKVSGYALEGLEGLFRTISRVQEFNEDLNVVGAIVNEYDGGASHKLALEELRAQTPGLIFDNMLRHRPPIDAAQMRGVPIWKVPHGIHAAKEFRLVVEELLARIDALI